MKSEREKYNNREYAIAMAGLCLSTDLLAVLILQAGIREIVLFKCGCVCVFAVCSRVARTQENDGIECGRRGGLNCRINTKPFLYF